MFNVIRATTLQKRKKMYIIIIQNHECVYTGRHVYLYLLELIMYIFGNCIHILIIYCHR